MKKENTVMHKGRNIFTYEMNEYEKLVIEGLRTQLVNIYNEYNLFYREKTLFQDDIEFILKYKENIGYIAIVGERGIYRFMKGFPTKDKNSAIYLLLLDELERSGFSYELYNREKLKEQWDKYYNINYDSRKAAFEYVISSLIAIYQAIPHSVIKQYTRFLNIGCKRLWYYDEDSMMFVRKQH